MAMTKQFTKTQWNNDREPAITAEQLNRIEKGIDVNDTRIVELDKAVTANKTAGDKSLAEVNKILQKHTEDITAVNNELTSQVKAIGELADKKITKFYASSQGDTTLNDSDNGKMQDMMLYGKSEQKQYSGKNLLNATLQTTTKNGVTCTANGDGTYTLNGTASANTDLSITNHLSVVNGKKYRLIGYPPNNNNNGRLYLVNGTVSASDYGSGATFTYAGESTDNRILHIYLYENKTFNNLIIKPMIVDADKYPSVTYDDFEPYVGGIPSPNPDYPQEIKSVVEPVVKVTNKDETESQSVTLTGITLNAIPVSSGGNVTIDGQQYISDYVDVERGKIVRMVNNARLLSSYNWYTGDKFYFGSVTGATNSKEPIVADNSKKLCLCNYFVALPMYDLSNNVKKGIAINNLKQVTISLEEFASAEDLKTFLANNDVRLVYPLATPTEESLSDELTEKLKALQTYYSQTNLFITSNQLDGYAIFNYPISLANGWNYVKQQIGDTRDYIYDMDLQMAHAYVNSEYAVALTELEV